MKQKRNNLKNFIKKNQTSINKNNNRESYKKIKTRKFNYNRKNKISFKIFKINQFHQTISIFQTL